MANWFNDNSDKRFCVLGLGLSGLSCLSYLLEHGIKPVVADTRSQPPQLEQVSQLSSDIELQLGDINLEFLLQFDFILMSPGIDPRAEMYQQAQTQGVKLINEIELFAYAMQDDSFTSKVIGVTGSNGKSTVVSLLGEVLNASGINCSVGGNIGRPALDVLQDNADCYVLELSSFQLEFSPSLALDVAMVLNVSEDHMDRYAGLQDYANTKQNIYRGAKHVIFNAADKLTQPQPEYVTQAQITSFALNQQACESDIPADWTVDSTSVTACYQGKAKYQLAGAKLVGAHNQLNMLAVLAACESFELDAQRVERALAIYNGLAHRCQLISEYKQVQWINDSKATNVGATLAAIAGLVPTLAANNSNLILIAGGVGKDADFSPLKSALEQVKQLITIGRDGDAIAQLKVGSRKVADLQQAVLAANEVAQAGDIVLLSPACASLDMFNNFEQRGLAFQQAVEALV